ncbi:MAG: phosphodiester glycosidase family protein, partial [Clostridia bacterium]|nr:phosphodiester glycosidase family protein [Clostridia bacterium]
GMVYQDGELVSTPSKDNFVSFVVTEENRVIFDYFTFTGTLYAENTSLTEYASCELYQINKVPVTTGPVTMITSAWGKTLTVPENNYAMICEMHDEDTYKMTSLSWGGEKVEIPEGGAVFVANYSVNGFLNENFAVGDIIRVETSITPDIEAIREASGGNTLLVKDGEIATFTSNITGKAQRSAMGLSPSGKTLVLVTIDGREADCPGFTQTELAEFMLALGCSDAINLDGGGSTTLVTPDRYTNAQTVQNTVSAPRKVSTALGVISHHETGDAEMGEMKLSKETILLGDSVDVTTVFYDEYYNTAPIDLSKLKITCSDPYAIVENNRVMPTTKGIHTIKVSYKGITLKKDVRVLGDVFAINVYPEVINTISADKALIVTAYDLNGHSATIPSNLITFRTTGDVTLSGNTVKKGEGVGTVTAVYEDLTSVAVVNGEKYQREDDVKSKDVYEGFIENGEKIVITGAIKESDNLIGRFQARKRLEDLATRGDVYALSDDIYDPWNIFTVYRKTNGFTQRVIENTRVVTVANSKSSSIRLTEANAWDNLRIVFDSITEDNLVLITNEPIYNMNEGEQKVWNYNMKLLSEKGVNVFVVTMGEKSEVTVQDGVRYMYVGSVGECTNASFEYGLKASSPLTLTFKGDEIKYTFN